MASSYNTRSRTNTATSGSSMTTEPRGQPPQGGGTTAEAIGIVPVRHFCIALTNNPRMLRGAEQALRDASAARAAVATAPVIRPQAAAAATSLPTVQRSTLPVPSRLRSMDRPTRGATEQQVVPILPVHQNMAAAQQDTYERDLEEGLKVQVQTSIQNYLHATKRTPPVNIFLDMSSMIQF